MKKHVIYTAAYNRKDISVIILESWLKKACEYFIPVDMRRRKSTNGKYHKYNEKRFWCGLDDELKEQKILIELSADTNYISISQNAWNKDYLYLTFVLGNEISDSNFEEDFQEYILENAIVAYSSSFEDSVQQSAKSVTYYEMKDLSLDGVKLKDSKTVDIEYNPGHMHYVNGLMFGSCYRMWFGKEFYQYISKEKLQSFSNCYENIELENEVTRITLYENLWDFAKPENREIQWDFRRSVGMDEVAHALEEEFSKKKVTDPEVEIKTGSFPHGGIRLIHQYFDGNGNITHKSKAKIVKSAEYSADGKILFSEENSL